MLLAQQADLHLALETAGEESYDRLDFTHCRAFFTESTVRFEPDSQATVDLGQAVPALLLVTIQLTTPITDKEVVGTLIKGKVSGDVRHKGKIVIRDGSLIHGRIRRLERHQSTTRGDFIVGLEFTDVETTSGPVRFYADLLRMDRHAGIRPALSEQVIMSSGGGYETRSQTITLPELPGVASFFVGGNAFPILNSLRMVWRTRGPIR